MADPNYKRYTTEARRGIKGEAFFESLVVDQAIPHRIARQNDLGVDFLCEWIQGDCPRGVLFVAQVKTTTGDLVECEPAGTSGHNGLEEFSLTRAKSIDERTVNYWKGLGLPAFLFFVIENQFGGTTQLECFYKRYTPLLDGRVSDKDTTGSAQFYKVSAGAKFLAFADAEQEINGFARDLVIDYARLAYSKGHVIPLTPRGLGFWPFPNKENPDAVRYFGEFLQNDWYGPKIRETCDWTIELLN